MARRYGSFPVILETYRECLQDVFDLPALREPAPRHPHPPDRPRRRRAAVRLPVAASLLFDYIATYMYEDDTPAAERRAQALSLDRDLLRELMGRKSCETCSTPGAIDEVERSLRRAPRDPDELHDALRVRGDLRQGEFDEAQAAVLGPSAVRCAYGSPARSG